MSGTTEKRIDEKRRTQFYISNFYSYNHYQV
eukprot:SAG31_NODE_3914_length_3756_cov_1.638228_4_plen_31_part_00